MLIHINFFHRSRMMERTDRFGVTTHAMPDAFVRFFRCYTNNDSDLEMLAKKGIDSIRLGLREKQRKATRAQAEMNR